MAMKNVVGLFDTIQDAEAVVRDLRDAGVAQADISFAGRNADEATLQANEYVADHSEAAEGAGFGATGGTVVGGLTGLLVGLGALAIPGVGPVIAAGSLATALGSAALGAGIGAATGGLLGALVGAGIPEEDANVYSEGIRRGGALVMAKVDDSMVDTALDIMERHNVIDIDERGATYRQSGWSNFDAQADMYAGATTAGASGTLADRDRASTAPSADATYSASGDADRVPDGDDYDRSSKIGTAGGAVAGAATGAAVGSAGGPVGTVIGGVAGAVVGGGVGAAGDAAGVEASDNDAGRAGYAASSDVGPPNSSLDYNTRASTTAAYEKSMTGDTGDYTTRPLNTTGSYDNTTRSDANSTTTSSYGSATDYSSGSTTRGPRRSRSYVVSDTTMGQRSVGSEGVIENTASRIENATERGLNTDLDRDGDVGTHDKRDNY